MRTSGITARPNTFGQPNAAVSPGANRAANTVPELPAPAMPSAVPWWTGGYQREASGSATAKEAPATPSTQPTIRTCENVPTPNTQADKSPRMTSACMMAPVSFGLR